MTYRTLLLAGTALLWVDHPAAAQPAVTPPASAQTQSSAQPAQPLPEATDEYGDESDDSAIVVTGTKARGSVIGDIPPQTVLDSRDIQATGATNINELLDALAPQIGSVEGRGGEQPVLLLNGQRISGFRELRDIPTEAIERVEILPEEVALKYGYSADQKVVNIVLRRFFRSTAALARGQIATEGGYEAGTADVTRLMIGTNGRTSLNAHAEGNNMLTEADRNITQPSGTSDAAQESAARSLIASKLDLRAASVINRTIFGDVGATLNTEVEHNEGKSLFGLSDILLPLARNSSTDTAHVGTVLNWGAKWQWSSTANADYEHDATTSDRRADLFLDNATTTQESANADLTGHGTLFMLPSGNVSTTARIAASTLHMTAVHHSPDLNESHSLDQTAGTASINLDVPLSRRGSNFSALGNVTINGNAQVEHLSDFGTLTKYGGGVNLSPVERLELIGSWTREEGAPTVQQLGNPLLETPGTRLFDFVTGQTVLATVITGGNPNLLADRRTVLKIGGNWQPWENTDLRFRANYVHQVINRPISDLPGPTAAVEAAFPDRFVRNAHGQLISADLRPVNFDSSRRDQLEIGFDFTHPLKSARPSAATIAAFRQRMAAAGMPLPQTPEQSNGQPSNAPGVPPPSGSPPPAGGPPPGGPPPGGGGFGRGGGRFRGGGGFFGGGRNGGRVMFSLTDTITFVDRVTIRPGLSLDYLHGDAIGQSGGQPRHDIQARANYFNNGLGAQLVGNWRSGTEVNTATGDNLHFSPYSTFDLRLFANVGQMPDLVLKHPWLRGASVHFDVTNIFDARPQVHNSVGQIPFSYQPNLLEPLGQTISITFRKLFLPPPSFFRQQYQQYRRRQQQQSGSTGG